MRDRYRDELLGFGRKRAIGKDALAECPEGGVDFGCKLASLLRELLRHVGVHVVMHGNPPLS
jgi:hypothetical protein